MNKDNIEWRKVYKAVAIIGALACEGGHIPEDQVVRYAAKIADEAVREDEEYENPNN